MIDVHCHILPALDDGARDLDDAVEMARQADADGIDMVCATPHIRHDHDVVIGELPRRVGELNEALRRRGVGARVTTGGEVAETAVAGLNDCELRDVSLGGGRRWILVEPAPGPLGASLIATAEHLRERGFRSVIAHPERHAGGDLATHLATLVAHGALVQVTAAVLVDGDAGPLVGELAEAGLVHLLGSDAHSSRAGRPVRLSGGFAALAGIPLVRPHLAWLVDEAPRALLHGKDVVPPYPVRC